MSTAAQGRALQLDALAAAGVDRVWEDTASGGSLDRRLGLDELLSYARAGDVIVVYSLSRISRSVRDLLRLTDALAEREVGLRSLTESVDTSAASPFGQFQLQLLGALAELERAMLRERTKAGIEAARARGRVGGRPGADPERLDSARQLILSGVSATAAARTVGLSRSTVYAHLADEIASRTA